MHLIDGMSYARRQRDRNPHYLPLKAWHSSKSMLSITQKYHKILLELSCKNPNKPLEDNRTRIRRYLGKQVFLLGGKKPEENPKHVRVKIARRMFLWCSEKNANRASNLYLHLLIFHVQSQGKKWAIDLLYTISKSERCLASWTQTKGLLMRDGPFWAPFNFFKMSQRQQLGGRFSTSINHL